MKYLMPALTVTLSAILLSACIIVHDDDINCPRAGGDYVTEEVFFPPLRGFELNMSADLYYTYGPEQRVTVEARTDVLDELSTDVQNGIWEIELDRCLRYDDVEIEITTPYIDHIELAGSGRIVSTNVIATDQDLDLILSGSGDFDLAVEVDDIDLDLLGSGRYQLEGTADEFDLYVAGSGDVNAFDLETLKAHINIAGSGDVRTTVLDELWVRITGSGDVFYKGDPEITVEITGSGALIDAN